MFAPFPWEFYLNYKVSTEIQGLSSTDRNLQGLSKQNSRIFKDFQGVCEPCPNLGLGSIFVSL